MGIFQELINFDTLFANCRHSPIIVNDFVDTSNDAKAKISNLVTTRYNTDLLNNIPTCECSNITGEYNLDIVCPRCNTPVSHPRGDLEPIVWIRAPNGVRDIINPHMWLMLSTRFTVSGFSLLHWITQPSYNPEISKPPFWNIIESAGLKRGYNYFVDNFDDIMELFFSLKIKGIRKNQIESYYSVLAQYRDDPNAVRKIVDPYMDFLCQNRDKVFSKYLPTVNRALLVIENTNSGTYVDTTMIGAIDAITMMIGVDNELSTQSVREKENRTIKMIDISSMYYAEVYKENFTPKEGIIRKHVFGTRTHFSGRAVISSMTTAHAYDEIHISWSMGIGLFEIHLTNKLLKLGYTPNQAKAFLYAHVEKYDPLLDKLFNELINEADNKHVYPDDPTKWKGIFVTFLRNPSLGLGSIQAVRITRIKTEIADKTISMSILITKQAGADFDGDNMTLMLMLDNYTASRLKVMVPHRNVIDIDAWRSLSDCLSLPKPFVSMVSNWLGD